MRKVLILWAIAFITTACYAQTFNKERLDSLFRILSQKEKFMGSIAVSQNDKILYSNAIGFADLDNSKNSNEQTKYRIGSISKMFTAVLVLQAVEEKKINLNQTLNKYFPEIENSEKITIENLLNHRSGIHNFTNDSIYMTYYTQFKSQKEILNIITNGKSDFEPNTQSEYSNSNYVLLSYILEIIYKKDYATILNQKIIKPLGLKNTYFGGKINISNNESYSYSFENNWIKQNETDMSIPMGAGAIVSNPTDLTVFIEKLFTGKIISQESLKLMQTTKDNYGMGMFEFPYYDKKSYGHTGGIDGFQSILVYFVEEKLAIALTSNGVLYKNNNILLCTLSCFFNKPFKIPNFEEVKVSPDILKMYVGEYASQQIPLKISVTQKENKLFVRASGQPEFPLEASSSTTFKIEAVGAFIEFNAEKKEMKLKQSGAEFLFTKE